MNYPPGVSSADIPGCSPRDEARDKLIEDAVEEIDSVITNTAAELDVGRYEIMRPLLNEVLYRIHRSSKGALPRSECLARLTYDVLTYREQEQLLAWLRSKYPHDEYRASRMDEVLHG